MDPVGASITIGKLISAGLALKKALITEGFDDADVGALKAAIETGGGLFSLAKKGNDPRPAALHLALTSLCFGIALGEHWAGSTAMVPGATHLPGWLTRWWNKQEHDRREDILLRTKYAERQLLGLDQASIGALDLEALTALTGSPLGNPLYRALWRAFSNPALCDTDTETPLLLNDGDAREFERHFRMAWVEAVATQQGQQVQTWRLGLAEERAHALLGLLAEDLAAWGRRHVFGNARVQPAGDPIPFMALDDMYVEPRGVLTFENRQEPENQPQPILSLIRDLLSKHRLVIIKADFGHGKSLTARRLARDLATEWLSTNQVSDEVAYPIFVKCVRDVLGDYNHEMCIRRAIRATAQDALGQTEGQDSSLYKAPEGKNTCILLDGLDEIAFQPHQLREMFGLLEGHTGDRCRAVVFTRPGALYSGCVPKGTPIVDLQSLDEHGIQDWLGRWNGLRGQIPLTLERLRTAEVENLARVPILLLMIALTWNEHESAAGKLDQARLYEHFFRHIAHGKHDGDTDEHLHIQEASARLLQQLQTMDVFPIGSTPTGVDAMLWMMSRAAWEAHRLNYSAPPQDLQQRHVEALVADELHINPSDAFLVKVGLLLALQFNPSGDGTILLFGHQSFREFLVARYWQTQLSQIATKRTRRREAESNLMRARLYQPQDKAFFFLREMLSNIKNTARDSLAEWAEDLVNDESLSTGEGGRFRDDRRSPLREAALAIGCELKEGLALKTDALRSLQAWFTVQRLSLWAWAPRVNFAGANLSHLHLEGSNLAHANLEQADLTGSTLIAANLDGAVLKGARMLDTRLSRALLRGANMEGAKLSHGVLFAAQLQGANLRGVNLNYAYLAEAILIGTSLANADLEYAMPAGANFEGADLRDANLKGIGNRAGWRTGSGSRGAIFNRAMLQRANLLDARLRKCTFIEADMEGVIATRADFSKADLSGANLSGANLCGANLQGATLRGVRLAGAVFDQKTRWPVMFSNEAAQAAGASASTGPLFRNLEESKDRDPVPEAAEGPNTSERS